MKEIILRDGCTVELRNGMIVGPLRKEGHLFRWQSEKHMFTWSVDGRKNVDATVSQTDVIRVVNEIEPKHISQQDAAKRALFQEAIQECLLAIVVAQGRPVTLPIEHIERLSASHRLVVGVDRASGFVTLTAEKFELEAAAPHEVDAMTKGTLQ